MSIRVPALVEAMMRSTVMADSAARSPVALRVTENSSPSSPFRLLLLVELRIILSLFPLRVVLGVCEEVRRDMLNVAYSPSSFSTNSSPAGNVMSACNALTSLLVAKANERFSCLVGVSSKSWADNVSTGLT